MNKDYKILFNLLNDENDQSAALVMAELLSRNDRGLDEILRKLQETSDPRLRRRIHQLQSTIVLRRRRNFFSRKLMTNSADLLEGLIQIHLLWFDNDSADSLRRQFDSLCRDAAAAGADTLESLASFMRGRDFRITHKDEFEPENFCIGAVLDEFLGADFILCSLAAIVCSRVSGGKTRIFVTQAAEQDFILADSSGNILVPVNDWDFVKTNGVRYHFVFWNTQMLLRYAGAMLFTCAAATDSFRYVYTIGSCLSGAGSSADDQGVTFLPYPYGQKN